MVAQLQSPRRSIPDTDGRYRLNGKLVDVRFSVPGLSFETYGIDGRAIGYYEIFYPTEVHRSTHSPRLWRGFYRGEPIPKSKLSELNFIKL